MVRPLKNFKYKIQGSSLAQYKEGEYIGSIPHDLLYQLILLKKEIGKDNLLVKLDLINKMIQTVGFSKEN